jgi:energy-coupling factor transporter ATP-binding protein EcfA2
MYDDTDSKAPRISAARKSAPRTVQDTGLPFLFLTELLGKTLATRGQLRLSELAAHSKLPPSVLDPLLVFMRAEKLCEIIRRGGSGTDADLHYNLTETGRLRAAECLQRDAYAGPAPVPLADYAAQVARDSARADSIQRTLMEQVFGALTISPALLRQLGAALNSGRALFLHGPAGSGKTFLAEQLRHLLPGEIMLPHAILVDGAVVSLYDPLVHMLIEDNGPPDGMFERRAPRDQRWLRSQRPAVLTGGELTLEMLDLRFDPASRLYLAPPHLKANGGIFIIDDLGRQRCTPGELMNRWIVPMDRRLDYLTLQNGYKFPVPFDMAVVFSSNLTPDALDDAAFLRRLGYKIHVGPLNAAQYESVFRQQCVALGIAWQAESFRYLRDQLHARQQQPLMACHPRDLLGQVCDLARYEGRSPQLSPEVLDWAWKNYFTGV